MIKVDDIAFVRFNAPDLDLMEAYLLDFGLVRAHRDTETLYMRGVDHDPFFHVTHQGEPGFVGVAFEARTLGDLEALAIQEGVAIESLDGPGGGKRIRLKDPDGFNVEVVAGRAPLPALPIPAGAPTNDARGAPRRNHLERVASGPSHVKRLGLCVLNVSDFRRSEAWYKQRLGFIISDESSSRPNCRSAHSCVATAMTAQPIITRSSCWPWARPNSITQPSRCSTWTTSCVGMTT